MPFESIFNSFFIKGDLGGLISFFPFLFVLGPWNLTSLQLSTWLPPKGRGFEEVDHSPLEAAVAVLKEDCNSLNLGFK